MSRWIHKPIFFVLVLCLIAGATASAAPLLQTTPDVVDPYVGQEVTISVNVDLSAQGDSLGAYSFELNWNPLILSYTGAVDGTSGFGTPNKNESNTASGSLLINAFNVTGVGGNVHLLDVSFTVVGVHNDSDSLTVQASSLAAALTFADLRPGMTTQFTSLTIDNQRDLELHINQVGFGTTTPDSGLNTYARGTVVNLTATPAENYRFVSWTGNVADSTSASTTITMNDDEVITANFEIIHYQLTVAKTGPGTVDPPEGTTTRDSGDIVNLTATPAANYRFVSWTGDVADPNSPTTTVTMTSDQTVTANFAIIQYNLTMGVNGQGTTTPAAGTTIHDINTEVPITATPSPGYQFAGWTGNVADPGNPSTTVTMTSDQTVTANFTIIQYTLTMAVTGSGTVDPAAGPHTYDHGTLVTVTATPAEHFRFVSWTGNVADSTSASTTITVTSNQTVTAHFEYIQYQLTTAVNGSGTVDPPAGPHTYNSGDVVDLVATEDFGHRFVNWTGNVADPDSASTTITMSDSATVTANFEVITFELTVAMVGNGVVTPAEGVHTYNMGTVVDLEATPNEGSEFFSWTGNVNNTLSHTTTITMLADETVTANFQLTNHTLSIVVNPPEGGTTTPVAGDQVYPWGTLLTASVTPAAGYRFLNWSGIVSSTSLETAEFQITGDDSLTANLTTIKIWGDVDDSYGVNVIDALRVATYEIDPGNAFMDTILIQQRGDVNASGVINSADALICASYEIDPANPIGSRVGRYVEDVAKPAATMPSARALISVNVKHDNEGHFKLVPVVNSDNGQAVGAAAIYLKWDVSSFQYVGMGENNGSIVSLSYLEEGEIRFSRFNPAGELNFDFPEVILSQISDNDDHIQVHVMSAALAGTAQELIPEGTVAVEEDIAPRSFVLQQNVPNPFNPDTMIMYAIPGSDHIRLDVYSLNGQRIRTLVDGVEEAGEYTVMWDGRDDAGNTVGSGIYLYRLQYTRGAIIKRMTLIR